MLRAPIVLLSALALAGCTHIPPPMATAQVQGVGIDRSGWIESSQPSVSAYHPLPPSGARHAAKARSRRHPVRIRSTSTEPEQTPPQSPPVAAFGLAPSALVTQGF